MYFITSTVPNSEEQIWEEMIYALKEFMEVNDVKRLQFQDSNISELHFSKIHDLTQWAGQYISST